MFKFTPGYLTYEACEALNRLQSVLEARLGVSFQDVWPATPPLGEGGGHFIGDTSMQDSYANKPFRAEITAGPDGTGLYSWVEQIATGPQQSLWTDYEGGKLGHNATTSPTGVPIWPAYEANDNTALVGTVVNMRRAYYDATDDWVWVFDVSPSAGSETFTGTVIFTSTSTTKWQTVSGGVTYNTLVINAPGGNTLVQTWYPVAGANPAKTTTSTTTTFNETWYPIGGTNPAQKIDVTATTKTHTQYPIGGTNPIATQVQTATGLTSTVYPTGVTNPLQVFAVTSSGFTLTTYPTNVTNPVMSVTVTNTTLTLNTYNVNVTQPVNTVVVTATTYVNNLFPVGSTNKVYNVTVTTTTFTNDIYATTTTNKIYNFVVTSTTVVLNLFPVGSLNYVVSITYDANTFTTTVRYPTTTTNALTFAVGTTSGLLQLINLSANPVLSVEPTAAAGSPIVTITPNDDQIGIIVKADTGQTEDLEQWQDDGGNPVTVINENGDLQIMQDTAPNPADQPNCSMVPFIDCTPGAAAVSFLVKASDGSDMTLTLNGSNSGASVKPVASAIADATVTNTTTETTLIGTVTGSTTLDVDTIVPGQTIDFKASGYYSSDAVPGAWQFRWYLGGTVIWDSGSVSVPSASSDLKWWFTGTLTCRTDGAGGTAQAQGELLIKGVSVEYHIPVNTSTFAVDTTAANVIDFSVEFDTADPDNSITSTNVLVTKGTPA